MPTKKRYPTDRVTRRSRPRSSSSSTRVPTSRIRVRALEERLAALEGRLAKLEPGKGRDLGSLADKLARDAIKPVMRAIDEKLKHASSTPDNGGGEGYNHQHFLALAREVKGLKNKKDDNPSREVVRLLNAPRFKELLDKRLRGLREYLENEVIPRVVRETLEQV